MKLRLCALSAAIALATAVAPAAPAEAAVPPADPRRPAFL